MMVRTYEETEALLGNLLGLVTLARNAGQNEVADEIESVHDELFYQFRDELEFDDEDDDDEEN